MPQDLPRPARFPSRMSAPDPATEKPSSFWAVALWIAFIAPMIFVWWAYQSVLMVLVLLVIRIAIMFVPYVQERMGWVKKPVAVAPANKPLRSRREKGVIVAPVVEEFIVVPAVPGILSILLEELKSEVNWVLEKVHLRNAKEEEGLALYRRLRGWE